MTERARMWRAVDVVALAGLLVLLVGLPASGSTSGDDAPYARATSFEVPWPRVGDHIVYDLIVDDENGVRNHPAVLEVQRRLATPGEVPVDARYVEERVFRPVYAEEGNFLLDSRGWTDRTYYLETGERAYAVAEGVRPDMGDSLWRGAVVGWVEASWEGQMGPWQSDDDRWRGFGAQIEHVPDDAAALAMMVRGALTNPDQGTNWATTMEAVYEGQHLFASGFGDRLGVDRFINRMFPPTFDEPCRLTEAAGFATPYGATPFVSNWSVEDDDCGERSGVWLQPSHAGYAGHHQELQWKDGRRVTIDVVPRVLQRGDGPEYRPITQSEDMDHERLEVPTRNVVPPEQVSVLKVDEDLRPVVRNLSLPLLKQALGNDGAPQCLADFLDAGARIVSFQWHLRRATVLPAPVALPTLDLPALPTGHAPADAVTVYEADWVLGLMTPGGQAMTVAVDIMERYPGPTLTFGRWVDWGDGQCLAAGQAVSPTDVAVVPAPLLAQEAERTIARHLQLAAGERDSAVTAFGFAPAFEWSDPATGVGPMPQIGRCCGAILSQSVGVRVPQYDWSDGHAAFANYEANRTSRTSEVSGAFSTADGGTLQQVLVRPSHDTPAVVATAAGATMLQVLDPKPVVRDAGILLLASWVLMRLAAAIRIGAHFPAVAWLYAKIQNADVLLHERRAAIVELLRADPGLTATDVAKRLGLGWGATVHHLDRLKQAGLVRSVRDGRRRRFVVAEAGVPAAEALARAPERARVVAAVTKEPGLTASELAKRLHRDRSSVARVAARLVEANLVERRRDGRKVRFFPASDPVEH